LRLRDALRAPESVHIKCKVPRTHGNRSRPLLENRKSRWNDILPQTYTTHHKRWSKNESTYLPVCHSGRSGHFTILLVDALAGCSAKTLAQDVEIRLLRRFIRSRRQVKTDVAAVEAVLFARRWGVGCTWARNVFGSRRLGRAKTCWCVKRLFLRAQLADV
jgi:hypothetical protein